MKTNTFFRLLVVLILCLSVLLVFTACKEDEIYAGSDDFESYPNYWNGFNDDSGDIFIPNPNAPQPGSDSGDEPFEDPTANFTDDEETLENKDTDNDGIKDATDTDDDNDGILDNKDTDDDNDGIKDSDEKNEGSSTGSGNGTSGGSDNGTGGNSGNGTGGGTGGGSGGGGSGGDTGGDDGTEDDNEYGNQGPLVFF